MIGLGCEETQVPPVTSTAPLGCRIVTLLAWAYVCVPGGETTSQGFSLSPPRLCCLFGGCEEEQNEEKVLIVFPLQQAAQKIQIWARMKGSENWMHLHTARAQEWIFFMKCNNEVFMRVFVFVKNTWRLIIWSSDFKNVGLWVKHFREKWCFWKK